MTAAGLSMAGLCRSPRIVMGDCMATPQRIGDELALGEAVTVALYRPRPAGYGRRYGPNPSRTLSSRICWQCGGLYVPPEQHHAYCSRRSKRRAQAGRDHLHPRFVARGNDRAYLAALQASGGRWS